MKHVWHFEVFHGQYSYEKTYLLLTASKNPADAMRRGLALVKKNRFDFPKQRFNKLEYMGERDN